MQFSSPDHSRPFASGLQEAASITDGSCVPFRCLISFFVILRWIPGGLLFICVHARGELRISSGV